MFYPYDINSAFWLDNSGVGIYFMLERPYQKSNSFFMGVWYCYIFFSIQHGPVVGHTFCISCIFVTSGKKKKFHTCINHIDGIMVSMLDLSAVDRGSSVIGEMGKPKLVFATSPLSTQH